MRRRRPAGPRPGESWPARTGCGCAFPPPRCCAIPISSSSAWVVKPRSKFELVAGLALHEQAFQQGGQHLVALRRHGHADAEVPADRFVLAQQHVQDDAVDAVVLAVEQQCPDGLEGLAESVDPTFSLLVSGRVPGQVVVDDGLECVLQVDAFGEAVGRDQDLVARRRPPRRARRRGRPVPRTGARRSRHRRRCSSACPRRCVGDVVGGLDEPAEHDRVEAVLDQCLHAAFPDRASLVVLRRVVLELLALACGTLRACGRDAAAWMLDLGSAPGVMSAPSRLSSST